MPPGSPLVTLSPAFQRRLARTPLRRRAAIAFTPTITSTRFLSTSPASLAQTSNPKKTGRPADNLAPASTPLASALSALLARLSLPLDSKLHPALITCLTHRSYVPPRRKGPDGIYEAQISGPESNDMLNQVGNSLLGMFTSEHLAAKFPLLPTEALKSAVTAYAGPVACVSVARDLGIGVKGGGNASIVGGGKGEASSGIPIRWARKERDEAASTPVGKRFSKYQPQIVQEEADEAEENAGKSAQSDTFDMAITSVVRAFIGLIYQERGIHAARAFVNGHFLTRHLDLSTLFSFKNPMLVLRSVVARHLAEHGLQRGDDAAFIKARMLAQTGVNTQAPIFNVGLFLKSGVKLAEGHGSSIKMAEHRAAVNALHSFFLVRGDRGNAAGVVPASSPNSPLPTAVHPDFPVDRRGLTISANGEVYVGSGFGGLESLQESSKRSQYGGRVAAAKWTNAR